MSYSSYKTTFARFRDRLGRGPHGNDYGTMHTVITSNTTLSVLSRSWKFGMVILDDYKCQAYFYFMARKESRTKNITTFAG